MICKMLQAREDPAYIFQYAREHGYSDNLRDLRKSIQDISLHNGLGKLRSDAICMFQELPEGVHAIDPRDIAGYLAAKGETKTALADTPVARAYESIQAERPAVAQLEGIYRDYDAMCNQADPEHPEIPPDPSALDVFCDKYAKSLLKGFIEWLRSDSIPVRNAIAQPEDLGFVERGNCRVQLTKRMMFG